MSRLSLGMCGAVEIDKPMIKSGVLRTAVNTTYAWTTPPATAGIQQSVA